MAGAFVAHTDWRGAPAIAVGGGLVPLRRSAPGIDADATNQVPPSPSPLGVRTSATPSFAAKERMRAEERLAALFRGAVPAPKRPLFVEVTEFVPPVRPGKNARVSAGPALASRRRLDSAMRLASGSKRARTSRTGLASTIAPFNFPLNFSKSASLFASM